MEENENEGIAENKAEEKLEQKNNPEEKNKPEEKHEEKNKPEEKAEQQAITTPPAAEIETVNLMPEPEPKPEPEQEPEPTQKNTGYFFPTLFGNSFNRG